VVAGPLAVTAACAVLGACALAVAAWRRPGPHALRHARRRLVVAVGIASVALASVAVAAARRASPTAPPAGLRVTFLDVGQGDATLVQDRSAAILVDAGPPDGPIVQRLRRAGVRRLDLLAVTHAQADHEGGAAAVLRAVPVGAVLDGRDGVRSPDGARMAAEMRRRGVRRIVPDAGQVVRIGRLELRVLAPRREPGSLHAGEDPNQRAIVAEVRAERRRILLTADAESDVTAGLALGPADVMKVAHHGSADPGLAGVLARVRPRIAVIEVGAHNIYGHPAPPTLDALAGVPATYRTDEDGSVRLDLEHGVWRVRTHA
jgi:competence protein ComEC